MDLDSGHKVSVHEESLAAQGHLDISQSDARVTLDGRPPTVTVLPLP